LIAVNVTATPKVFANCRRLIIYRSERGTKACRAVGTQLRPAPGLRWYECRERRNGYSSCSCARLYCSPHTQTRSCLCAAGVWKAKQPSPFELGCLLIVVSAVA
jgi:hypothetical protein